MKQKSKILKLKNKQKFLKFWLKWGGWFFLANVLTATSLLMPCIMATVPAALVMSAVVYLGTSVILAGAHDIFVEDTIRQKMQDVDQEILELVKTDEEEVQILKEADKVETIQKDIKVKKREQAEQKQLVKELVKKKNLEAAAQKNYVKYLTKINKHNAKIEACV